MISRLDSSSTHLLYSTSSMHTTAPKLAALFALVTPLYTLSTWEVAFWLVQSALLNQPVSIEDPSLLRTPGYATRSRISDSHSLWTTV